MATLSALLKERGYVYQFSAPKLPEITDGEPRTFYFGVDPTADSMHVGQLQGILVLRRFIEAGHKLIIIVGGGTGMIGDPGGKSEERNLLSDETVRNNAEALRAQFSKLFEGAPFEMINNADWLHEANLMEFLRDIGKHFTVNEMIKRDTVRPRIETPDKSISFTEFSYMLLQAYDYLHLHEKYNCTLQVGGSDQWGNMISGVDLIRRKTGKTAHVFSWPLLVNKSTGKKFGKSEKGTVWLDPAKTSPFEFYQFWLNTEDDFVQECLLKMTLASKPEIDAVMEMHRRDKIERHPQKFLARSVTALVHGEEEATQAETLSGVLFGAVSLAELSASARQQLKAAAPSCEIAVGSNIIDVLVGSTLASSKREARQFLSTKAVSLNDTTIEDATYVLTAEDFQHGLALLKRGRRNVRVLVQQ
ncbi:MAG TPA: tyrosine--tRNA ligase [Candidatus Paceibacterota bacterium]|nr:tyrosine--tRNA ligase [Candidatus Paceibacterota bacterium]